MLRWLLLLALISRAASAAGRWWCSGEAIDSMPEGTTEEELELLRLQQEQAAIETRKLARARGKGPVVTEKLVEAAMIKVRDEAHDRVHLRQMDEALNGGAEAAELVPVQAMMPAGIVAKMMEQEKNRG